MCVVCLCVFVRVFTAPREKRKKRSRTQKEAERVVSHTDVRVRTVDEERQIWRFREYENCT